MLHLRVISPVGSTDQVLAALRADPGVTHVVLLRGAGIDPAGDVLQADVAREAADGVVASLCALGVDRVGGVALEQVDTSVSDAADRAEEAAPGEAADAVVWEELVARTGEESRLNATFLAFLSIACLLAGVAVVTDSTITLVGAMVVGPEFGPLAALAVGLVLRRRDLVRRAAVALAVGFPAAMLVTAGGALLGAATGLFRRDEVLAGDELDFVFQVGPFSLIVALLAGAAGMLSMTSAKSAALVGVFISVTTVPAAGYAAIGAVLGEWGICARSAAQLAVNLVGVVTAAALVLALRNRRAPVRDTGRPLSDG
ncbi:DUF389 domain-containing protein [Saccharothrix coeruleofusca]|uniref:Membrane protein n=1 Tax=Saccharothrix coeruleofusca TaxID=33919 RepID=A0A918AST6_9PSEU|nr:DUF389 domain-containing protein [Saccharothrix coeruleofusca]MBP2335206.1 putative hydrophobic protein (TIGR00271 family) [Saccharothrix coeruleofusca]GGP71581.1 membrane protein [Saccharothrix coeruleofusca]